MKHPARDHLKLLAPAVDAVIDEALAKLEKKSHARLSPSKAHRWLVCPGSLHVMTEDPETEWAAEGTRKHAVLELVLQDKPVLAGDKIKTEAGEYTVPLEVLEQCWEIKEFIDQFHQTHKDGWVVETETKVEIGSHCFPNMVKGESDGTVDVAAYSIEEMLVLDAKFGFVQVEARNNPQLMLYAAGLRAEIPFPIKWITLCIAQPGYDGEVIFREHRITVEQLDEWVFNQIPVIEEIQRGSRRLQADDHACRYCPARAGCSARLKALDDAASEEWLQSRSIEELLPYVPRLRAIARDIEQRAMAELSAGQPVRGWKVVASKSRRKWQDDGVAEKLADELFDRGDGLVPLDFYERKLKSPAQIENVIYRNILNKSKTKKEVKELVDKFTIVPTGAPKLAPESDPRPALEPATWTLEDALKATLEAFDGNEE